MTEVMILAHKIALEAAKERLVCETVSRKLDGVTWRDVDTQLDGVPLGIALKSELRYLTLRGALVWNPLKPSLVRIVEVDQ
jgi:hypothetical protein